MTVYVTGDIHGGLDMQKLRDWELGDSLTSDDYLIVPATLAFRGISLPKNVPTSLGWSRAPIPCCSSTATTSVSITGRSVPWSCGTAG
mgnify:CR=1 FL=1